MADAPQNNSLFAALRPASFRGVTFEVDDHDEAGGRRLARHEYPLRDIPYAEDLGKKAGEWKINAFFVHRHGVDVPKMRDALRDALAAAGPGTLIHPWLGELTVCVEGYSLRESTREGGYAQFSITFVEAGHNSNPKASLDTSVAVGEAAEVVAEAALGVLQAVLATLPDLAEMAAQAEEILAKACDVLAIPESTLRGAISVISHVAATPRAFAAKLGGMIRWGMGLTDGTALRQLFPGWACASLGLSLPDQVPPRGKTPPFSPALQSILPQGSTVVTRSSPVAQYTAVAQYIAYALLAAFAQSLAGTDFDCAEDALSARDDITDAIDMLADVAPDALYAPLCDLRVAVVSDIAARGAKLPTITRVTLPGTVPALVAAYRLYGDAGRYADIVRRNRIKHPGFVPGNLPLEVLRD